MKIDIEEADKKRLLNTIIKELKEDDHVGGRISWKGFQTNPINRAFKDEMTKQLKIIMVDILDNDEFKDQLYIIGLDLVRKLFKQDIKSILNKLYEFD